VLDKVRDEEKEKYVDDMDVTVCNVVLRESENGHFFFILRKRDGQNSYGGC